MRVSERPSYNNEANMDQALLDMAAEWIGVNEPDIAEADYERRLLEVASEIEQAERDAEMASLELAKRQGR